MIIESARPYVAEVATLYSKGDEESRKIARAACVGTLMQCLAIMSVRDRDLCRGAIGLLAGKMGNERFEDGMDFLQFLKDVVEEQKNEE